VTLTEHMDKAPIFFMGKYEGKPEFEESFFAVAQPSAFETAHCIFHPTPWGIVEAP